MYTQKMINKKMRWGDIFSALLVLILVYLSAAALEETAWVSGLNHVTALAILGTVIGLAIGQSQFNSRTSFWLVIAYSFVFLSWKIIFTGNENLEWLDKAFYFYMRVSKALGQLINNQPLQDGVLFILGMGIFYWFIGLLSGYYLNRHAKPWIPLGVAGLSIITIQLFQVVDVRNNLLSAVFAILLIILIVRINYWVAHISWIEQQVSEDVDTASMFWRVGLVLAIVLVVIAWSIPFLINVFTPGSDEQRSFSERFEGLSLMAENFFAPFKQVAGNQEGYFGHTLTMGNERSLSEKVIFLVSAPTIQFGNGRYYWRARVYDKYSNGFWQASSYEETAVSENQLLNEQKSGLRTEEFVFTAKVMLSTIFAYPEIVSLDRDVWVQFFDVGDGKNLLSVSPTEPIQPGDSYSVISATTRLFRDDLIIDREENTLKLREHYLQLPNGFSPKIKKLSEEITAGMNTDYEKVIAVNAYLRNNYEYIDRLEKFSDSDDPIEWFLFEYKKGFCNYFASAEVLLLRAAGIPARLAAGYSQGVRIEPDETFEVREKDSHSWVEVYFSGIGWVAFEPTPSQPILNYASKASVISSNNEKDRIGQNEVLDSGSAGLPFNSNRKDLEELTVEGEEASNAQELSWKFYWILSLTIVLVAFLVIIQKRVIKNKSLPIVIESGFIKRGMEPPQWVTEWVRHQRLTPFEKQFTHVDNMLRLLKENTSRADTPKQKIDRLIFRIPEIKDYALSALYEYEQEIYGRNSGNFQIIQSIIKKLWKATFNKFIEDKIRLLKKSVLKD